MVFSGGGNLSLFDWFCNLTVLWYFKLGGLYINWYLAAILILYLLHPFFYCLASKSGIFGGGFVTVFVMIFLYMDIDVETWHKMLIGRIPMYFYGALFFFYQRKFQGGLDPKRFFYKIALILFSAILVSLFFNIRGYILQDMAAPYLIIGIYFLYHITSNFQGFQSFIELLGRYSYQIFVANALTFLLLYILQIGFSLSYILYFPLNMLLAYVFICYNKYAGLIPLRVLQTIKRYI